MKRFVRSQFVRLLRRFLPLVLALWMNGDVALDIHQTVTYYRHAFYENGTCEIWGKLYQKFMGNIRNNIDILNVRYFQSAQLFILVVVPLFLI